MSVLDTLRAATPRRHTVKMCMDGALQAEWDSLLDELDAAAESDGQSGSLARPATAEVAERLDAIRDQVLASEVAFTFSHEALPWSKRIALQADHPPRDGNAFDRVRGFNVETYYPALIRATCVSVTGADGETVTDSPDDVWDSLLGSDDTPGSLNMAQVNKLASAAEVVVNGETAVPPSARSLLVSQDSGASLAQPGPGQESAPSGSEDGSRRGSPKSSTTKKAAPSAT